MRTGDTVRVKKTPAVMGVVTDINDADVVYIEVEIGTGVSYGYAEYELERLTPEPVDPIAEYYRNAEDRQARERDRWLAAGNSIQTFKPRTLID